MPASQPPHQPVTRLVLFMICLAITGSAVAAIHYPAVDLSPQAAPQAPHNDLSSNRGTCTQQNIALCEKGCTRPDKVLDLSCYELCVDEIC
jgi:hypothetical protein